MIKLTKLNNAEIVINDDLIEFIESLPDTLVSLIDGKKIMVKESPDEIIKKVAAFRRLATGTSRLADS
ncbi:MAG: flagellar FlbD family protein [candidate division Zixibacteria bacterium]|nr:flagellar FlbD family protein [candidate division Zixibacteria bacterium]